MSRSNFEDNQESLVEGILQVLGRSPLPPPTKSGEPCRHESDGFVYDKTATYVLLACAKCGEQYEQPTI
jgi:hypothetical protein